MSGREFFFAFPVGGYLILLLIPLLFAQWKLQKYRYKQMTAFNSSSMLSRLLVPRSFPLLITKVIGWTCIWLLSCMAFMGPFGNIRYPSDTASQEKENLVQNAPSIVIFLVDTSSSMNVTDGSNGQTRLEEAKEIMQNIIRQLNGPMIALYSFTSTLTPVVPPTLDYIFTRLSINDLQIDQEDVQGTRFAAVLESLKKNAFPIPSTNRWSVIMFTDGGDTQLESLQGEAQEKARQEILSAIPNPQELHLHLYPIGLGSLEPKAIPHVTYQGKPVFSKLEEKILKELAAKEGGVYYNAQNISSWDLAKELVSQIKQNVPSPLDSSHERQVTPVTNDNYVVDLYYQVPLGLAILLYFLYLLLPDVHKRFL